jgi:N-acetylmuramoyl-L-alanine amidase
MDKFRVTTKTWIWILAAIGTGFLTTLGAFLFTYTQNLIATHTDANDIMETYDESEYISQRIEKVFVHCTATYTDWSKEKLLNFFKNSRRWDKPGYHYYVRFDGSIDTLVHLDDDALIQYDEIAYGAKGNNSKSIHIAYAGGIDINGKAKDTRTEMQKQTINLLVQNFKYKYPWVKIYGHREVTAKSCPSFDSRKEFGTLNNYKPQY